VAKTSTVSKFFKKAKSQAPGPNGLDKSNCGARPTGRLMAQLATQEPTPPLELPEPPGMSGPQSTQALDGLLEVAAKRLHISLQQALLRDAGPFPVAGPATWTDDWHAFRSCPVPHLHEGQDIVAPMGTPLVSVAKGFLIGKGNQPGGGGLFVEVRKTDGMEYFYCHLSKFAPGLRFGQPVRRGQLLGYVGMTGDATGPHLHLQVEPAGIPAPPKPWIDRWLRIAMRRARVMAGLPPGNGTRAPPTSGTPGRRTWRQQLPGRPRPAAGAPQRLRHDRSRRPLGHSRSSPRRRPCRSACPWPVQSSCSWRWHWGSSLGDP